VFVDETLALLIHIADGNLPDVMPNIEQLGRYHGRKHAETPEGCGVLEMEIDRFQSIIHLLLLKCFTHEAEFRDAPWRGSLRVDNSQPILRELENWPCFCNHELGIFQSVLFVDTVTNLGW
jgi:hypothetical protein